MITKKELENYAFLRGIKNMGFAEKDYFQNILLFIIYQKFGNGVVFKGGTALYKCFGLDRFSEDLDFSSEKEIEVEFIEEGLKRFKVEYEIKEEKSEKSKSIILRIKGPLFNGDRNSFCKLVLDFSFREEILEKPVVKTIGRFLEEIPSFDVSVMNEKEIFAEKVRAILTRNKARDVYDFWFLLKNAPKLDKDLINNKLKYYNKTFNLNGFLRAVKEKEPIWKSELSGLIYSVPDFKEVFKFVKSKIGG